MNISKNWHLLTLIIITTGMGFIEVVSGVKGYQVSSSTYMLWSFSFLFLVAFWVTADSKKGNFEAPFELGFLIYILFPITLPWYLISTRGVDGILMFFGFILFYFGPWLAGVVAYVYLS